MAPEVVKKEKFDEKIDIWSLGIVLYELCTGKTPHEELTAPMIMCRIVHEKPPEIPKASPSLSDFLSHCVEK